MFEFDVALVQKFLLALAIGAFSLGIEREKHKSLEQHSGFAGLRTFILCGATWCDQCLAELVFTKPGRVHRHSAGSIGDSADVLCVKTTQSAARY